MQWTRRLVTSSNRDTDELSYMSFLAAMAFASSSGVSHSYGGMASQGIDSDLRKALAETQWETESWDEEARRIVNQFGADLRDSARRYVEYRRDPSPALWLTLFHDLSRSDQISSLNLPPALARSLKAAISRLDHAHQMSDAITDRHWRMVVKQLDGFPATPDDLEVTKAVVWEVLAGIAFQEIWREFQRALVASPAHVQDWIAKAAPRNGVDPLALDLPSAT